MANQITTNVKPLSVKSGGPLKSREMVRFSDSVAEDVQTLTKAANLNSVQIEDSAATTFEEMDHLRTSVKALEVAQDFRERKATSLVKTLDFYSRKDISYTDGTPESNKLVVDTRYGQVYLQNNRTVPLFYFEDAETGDITSNSQLQVSVVGSEQPVDGYVPQVEEGLISNAFNGYNGSYWRRRVSYPLEANVESVSATITVTVPGNIASNQFNVVSLNPYPLGRVDVDHIWYKADASASWALLPTFPTTDDGQGNVVADTVRNADHLQYVITPRNATQFQVKITQRDWTVQGNKKVFDLGLQEFTAKFVEFLGRSNDFDAQLTNNHHVIYKVEAPENTEFGTLSSITIGPDAKLEGVNSSTNHVIYTFAKRPDPQSSADIIWKSNTDALPQNGTAISLAGVDTYYVIIEMRYAESVLPASPFQPKTSPVVENVSMNHLLVQLVEDPEEDIQIDWTARNAGQHFNNQITMDILKETARDGSQMFLFWDDFWNDSNWRAALESSAAGLYLNPESMSLTVGSDVGSDSGNISYNQMPPAGNFGDPGDFNWSPAKIWLQDTSSVPAGADVTYQFHYNTAGGAQTPVTLTPGTWTDLPQGNGAILNFYISIQLTNTGLGGANGKPIVYQLAVITTD